MCVQEREKERDRETTHPRWREITVVAEVYPASVYPQQQIEIYDAASGNSLSLARALLQWHRPTTGAARRHDLGELRNKVKRSSAAVARFPARPREKARTTPRVCNADFTAPLSITNCTGYRVFDKSTHTLFELIRVRRGEPRIAPCCIFVFCISFFFFFIYALMCKYLRTRGVLENISGRLGVKRVILSNEFELFQTAHSRTWIYR